MSDSFNGHSLVAETPKQRHAPIKMRRVARWRDIEQAGDFMWSAARGTRAMMVVAVPRQNGGIEPLPLAVTADVKEAGRWKWNGDLEKPTLEPSLHSHGIWHGFVRAGELVEA